MKYLGRAWASPTLVSWMVDFSYIIYYIKYLPYVRRSVYVNWHSFNPKHCTRRSVRAKYWKQLRKGSTLEPFHFSWPSDALKSAQEQEDQRWRRKRQSPMCCRDSGPKLRNWGWGTMPDTLLKLLVKDKPLYSGKVHERREMKPLRREKRGCSRWETDWQWKTPRRETEDYSRQGPTTTQS